MSILYSRNSSAVKIKRIWKSKMVAGHHLEKLWYLSNHLIDFDNNIEKYRKYRTLFYKHRNLQVRTKTQDTLGALLSPPACIWWPSVSLIVDCSWQVTCLSLTSLLPVWQIDKGGVDRDSIEARDLPVKTWERIVKSVQKLCCARSQFSGGTKCCSLQTVQRGLDPHCGNNTVYNRKSITQFAK